MSDEKKYTEREVVVRERAAFINGWSARGCMPFSNNTARIANVASAEEYPLPKVTQPRVLRVIGVADSYYLRVSAGVPQCRRYEGTEWCDLETFGAPRLTVTGARALTDLLANPTEEVDA